MTRKVNSVTQAPIVNVLTSYLEIYVPNTFLVEEFGGQRRLFFKRLGTLLWFYLLVFGLRAFLKFSALPYVEIIGTALVTSDPTILANSSLVTVDVAFSAMVVWFLLFALRYSQKATLFSAINLGLLLTSLFATKFTAILFLPVYFTSLFLPVFKELTKKFEVGKAKLLCLPICSIFGFLLSINFIYLFIDIKFFISDYKLESSILNYLRASIPNLLLPLPQSFISGIDQCLSDERNVSWTVIYNDALYPHGSIWYFPFMYLYKNTLLVLGLVATSWYLIFKDGLLFGQKYILVILIFTLSYFCFIFQTQVGIRYILFTLPLIYIFISQSLIRRLNLKLTIIVSLLVWVNSLVCLYPNRELLLTYFNSTFVSSDKPYLYLVDANFDWFSSYYQLRKEQKKRNYIFDVVDPTITQPGINLYSTNYLSGVNTGFGRNIWLRRNVSPDERIAQTYFKFVMSKEKYRIFIRGTRDFKPFVEKVDDCKVVLKVGLDANNIPVKLPRGNHLCMDVSSTGEYLFNSKEAGQSIGIFSTIEGCQAMNFKKNEFVPFYLHSGRHIFCSKNQYKGSVSHLENVIMKDFP